jgi:DNA topoisomerase VI subunit A
MKQDKQSQTGHTLADGITDCSKQHFSIIFKACGSISSSLHILKKEEGAVQNSKGTRGCDVKSEEAKTWKQFELGVSRLGIMTNDPVRRSDPIH